MAILRANAVVRGPRGREATDLAVATWEACLADVSDGELEAALLAYLRDGEVCQFWPQPGKLRDRVPGRQAAQIDDSDLAWGEATRWVRDHARHFLVDRVIRGGKVVELGPPPWEGRGETGTAMTAALEVIGGPRAVINCGDRGLSTETEATLRKSFRDAYRAYLQRARHQLGDAAVLRLVEGSVRPMVEGPGGAP